MHSINSDITRYNFIQFSTPSISLPTPVFRIKFRHQTENDLILRSTWIRCSFQEPYTARKAQTRQMNSLCTLAVRCNTLVMAVHAEKRNDPKLMPSSRLETTILKEERLQRDEISFDSLPRSFFSSLFFYRFGYRISMTNRVQDDSYGRRLSPRYRCLLKHSEILDETSELKLNSVDLVHE
jgi:hypothetical protein